MNNALDPVALLVERVRTDGASPLLTCYDTADGSRVEFSGRTFANWVDKTTNLVDDLGIDEGSDIALPVLASHPGHWVSLVWAMAAWQAGCRVVASAQPTPDTELVVMGPDAPRAVSGIQTIACSLHPLGTGLGDTPRGVVDYAEVLSQPDVHQRRELPEVLLRDGADDASAGAVPPVAPVADRLLAQPTGEIWRDLSTLLLGPLLGGGSVVVMRGEASRERLEAIAAQERARLAP